ncbi:exodeoxyribonuclease VII large subunit [Actinotalea sp. Marseille-Q4924]|uniref:exodeoxyribonuclease VII large subunit n=1 Tax=Actinotalea sp. Marseille-Q4924 TaxID=2866571 RepID=UPI001CE3C456|nr:exodeoxyribonuclease VII large subunit [Actinotalea sp. Marseille-Q4924]
MTEPTTTPRRRLPPRALDTAPDAPWPVRHLSARIAEYVHRMPGVWVEGQVVQLNRRPGTTLAFLTLRDTEADVSLPVSVHVKVLDAATAPVQEGAHVVVHATPRFWAKRGTLQLEADEIRPVGLGELLARIEHLKRVLAAEGLFDASRKRPLPFLPHVVGLVCGRESKAEHDVVVNARARWPQVRFEIREVAVQGVAAVPEVSAALRELDADPAVEVIVIARGGGSVEDLLPFSNEALVRAAAACRTPLVSAIGHETDSPLLDLVADHRASTPTDAGKRVVPDVGEERARLVQLRGRVRSAVSHRLHRERDGLAALRSRPVLARPELLLQGRHDDVERLRAAACRALEDRIRAGHAEVSRLEAQVRALSPAATLERGYAVVQRSEDGAVVRTPQDAPTGTPLRLRLAAGELGAASTGAPGAPPRFTEPRAGRRRPPAQEE